MNEPSKLPFLDTYIDESSQTGHRFLVIGGVVIPTDIAPDFSTKLVTSRAPELGGAGEMKWVKVSRTKLPAYKRAVDLFFDTRTGELPHFHSLVVDTHKLNNRRYNEGSREIGFSKEIYQLCMKFGRLYGGLFHIYPDHRQTSEAPDKVRTILNFGTRKKGDKRDWPYRRMQFRHSGETPIIQLTDILAGAVAFRVNGHHTASGASPAKCELSEYIFNRAKIADVTRDTSVRGKFTIWHRVLK